MIQKGLIRRKKNNQPTNQPTNQSTSLFNEEMVPS